MSEEQRKNMSELSALLEKSTDSEAEMIMGMSLMFARKMIGEGREHGELDFDTDTRTVGEVAKEACDEIGDGLFYMFLLKKKLERANG